LLKVNDQTEKDAWQLQSKAGKKPATHSSLTLNCCLFDYVYMREPLSPTAGISKVGLDGTLYDQVLDWIFALGLAPARFAKLSGYDLYFAMARGTEGAVALDMSKFFDTNYHYMVCLVRVWFLPLSRHQFLKFPRDLEASFILVLTVSGVIPFSYVLSGTRIQ
jgi:hypothetical protein